MEFVLASASPRRQQMLRDLGVTFTVGAPDIDESRLRGEPALAYVERLAQNKAASVALKMNFIKRAASGRSRVDNGLLLSADCSQNWAILAADTIVVSGSLVLGKPA